MRVKLAVIFFCAIVFTACKSKDSFTLSGEVENPNSIKKVFLLEADTTGQPVKIDSAALSDQNKFSFKRETPYPNMYKLQIGGTMFDLIAQNGDDITFKTNALDTTNRYELTGSEGSEKIQEFNKLSNKFAKVTEDILAEYNYKTQKLHLESAPLFELATEKFKKNQKEYFVMVTKFMNDNKSSLAGFFASTALDPITCEPDLIKYADEIRGKFNGNTAVERFVKKMDYAKPLSVGYKAPDFMLVDEVYKPVRVSDFKGKYLMIDFWASWCAPCRKENPNVVKMYAKFKDKGLNILGVSLDEKREDWQRAIAADRLTWRQVSEFKNFNGPIVRMYHVEAIPSNFILDPEGNIVAKNITGVDLEDFLNKTLVK
ncbi:MAG: TlpA disulfide reductase family protein [Mucilaginibacter sp.]|uniref:TlpA disulfide reductase family protein n=1 Tax=Mucilaginibacter sp. TaxID=1882438 RepID=UPI003263FF6C